MVTRSPFLIPILFALAILGHPAELFAGSGNPAVERRLIAVLGAGMASAWNPSPDRDVTLHPVPGYRFGLLIASPGPPCTVDLGLMIEGRGTETHAAYWTYGPTPQAYTVTSRYNLVYLTAPMRFRIPVHHGPFGPYLSFGPELSFLVHAGRTDTFKAAAMEKVKGAATEKTVGRSGANVEHRPSVGAYTGLGVGRELSGHDLLLELGLSFEIMGVHGRTFDSGIEGGLPLLVAASVGIVL